MHRKTTAIGLLAGVVMVSAFWLIPDGRPSAVDNLGRMSSPGFVLDVPPPGKIYHAAFPGFGASEQKVTRKRIRRFERQAGRRIAWAYFSNNWWRGKVRFPHRAMRVISKMNRVPFVRLMARSSWNRGRDLNFTMESIAGGRWDADLRRWCSAAERFGRSFLAEFGTEVNGDWFPWNGRWNGAGQTDEYGDPGLADGPERFRDAYRRLIDICRSEGANSITWFFHVDSNSEPQSAWNADLSNYYPGDSWIDWIGVSNYGKLSPDSGSVSFRSQLRRSWKEIGAISSVRPIAILEYGRMQSHDDEVKARWIVKAIRQTASGRWPQIRGLAYWSSKYRSEEGPVIDLRIDSSKRVARSYRRVIAGSSFTGKTRFVSRDPEELGP